MAAKYGVSSQNISRTDVLCEGPVRGLKNGESSVFFNDVAAEDANLRGYNPRETATSGKITFDGTSATNTGITGATIPVDMDIGDRRPRPFDLKDYKNTDVTLSSVTSSNGSVSVTCTADSGTPFSDGAWDTQGTVLRTAYLKRDGVLIKGEFKKTSTTVGTFTSNTVSNVLDTAETHELRISYRFYLQSITDASTITLKAVPAAGTYFFEIPPLQAAAGYNAAIRSGYRASKIEGIQVEFRPGHRYQDPLSEIGGVGGSQAATQSVNHELKVIGTGELTGISPVPEDGTIGSTMESGLPDDSQDDVATDAVVLADTAFGITAAQRPEVDEISLRITYPGGLQSMNTEKGKRDPAYARYVIQIQTTLDGVAGDWENAFPNEGGYVEHTGRTNAAYSFDHVLGVNQYRPFDSFKIRVIRLTRHIGLRVTSTGHGDGVTNKEKWQLIAKSKIDQLGYVIKDRLSYPYTSVISTAFSSKQYQEPPKMSYLMQGLKVKVPSTYTPREYTTDNVAKYEDFWDGTFKSELQYTDNPAWVFYDIVTNNRYGAGRWIKETDIDKYALYRIARYCDELVDNGAGGTEPRFRSNVLLTKATDVYKVLKDFASTFTGMLYWMDGFLTPVQDSPSDPVYNFSKGNVFDGKFKYESSGLKTRANQVVVTWNDPKSNYEPVPLIVEDREAIIRDKRLIKEEAVAFGCTSEAQAIRYGRWKLWTAQKQTEIINFKSALNSLYIKPGDVINVQDADRQGVQYSGRVSSSTSTQIVLDRTITLNSGSTYTLSTLVTEAAAFYVGEDDVTINSNTYSRGDRIPEAYVYDTTNDDGTYDLTDLDTEEKASNAFDDSSGTSLLPIVWKKHTYVQEDALTNSASSTNTLTVSGFGVTPSANTIWALKEEVDDLNVLGSYKTYRVLSIVQESANEYSFSAVEHYDEKYGAVDNGYATSDIPSTIYNESEPTDGETEMAPPTSLRVILESDPDKPGEEIRLEWEPSTSDYVQAYEVRHNLPDIPSPIRTGETLARIQGIPSDTFRFDVRAVSTKGNYSDYVSVTYTFVDPYEEAIPRTAGAIPKGGYATSQLTLNSSNALKFQATNTEVSTVAKPETTVTITGTTDVSDVAADKDYLVYLDTSATALELLYYETEALTQPFYYDVGTGNTALSSSWTSIGTVSVTAGKNTLSGTGLASKVKIGDILNLENTTSPTDLGSSAIVTEVVSDTEIKLDRVFDSDISSITGYRATFRPGYEDDAVIAKVRKTGNNIEVTSFLTLRTAVDDQTTGIDDDGITSVNANGINATHIAANSITSDLIAANSIAADQIAANAITADLIAANQITSDQISANSITSDLIAANQITSDQISANSITSDLIAANQIGANEISANSITSSLIAANQIGANEIAANSITSSLIAANQIGANEIAANSITSSLIAANQIAANEIAANAITASAIAAGSITANELAANSLTANAITANSVLSDLISANAVQASDISTSTLSALSADLGDITAGTMKGGNVADANAAPGAGESGAFLDLTGGKMVFGDTNKYILFDGTNLELNGVVIDSSSTINAAAQTELTLQEDGTQEITNADVLNFSSGLDVTVSGTTATIALDTPTDNNFTNSFKTKLEGIATGANNYSLPTASSSALGGVRIGYTESGKNYPVELDSNNKMFVNVPWVDTNTVYSTATSSALGLVKIGFTESGKNYPVELNASNQMFVNVPWTDTDTVFTLGAATSSALGGIKIGYTESGDNYAVKIDADNEAFVTVPSSALTTEEVQDIVGAMFTGNTETRISASYQDSDGTIDLVVDDQSFTLALAADGTRGGIQVGYTENGKNYPVELSSEKAFVNVPWTDNNTTYTAGTGLDLSAGNEFSIDTSTVVDTSSDQTIAGAKTFSGNVTFTGTTTYVNTTNLNVGDNIITLNADIGANDATQNAGIEIDRGNYTNKTFLWDETNDKWTVGSDTLVAGTFEGNIAVGNITGDIVADGFGSLTTDDLTEGTSNLYFTDSRAQSAITVNTGLDIASGQISLDLSELTDMTAAITKTQDELILLDNGAERRKLIQEIPLSAFNNDLTDSDTTYDLSVPSGTTKIRLAGSDSTNDDIEIVGGTNVTVTRNSANQMTISSTDTNTQLSTEEVQDIVGAMFTGNTETRISATYEDSDGTIDLVVTDQSYTLPAASSSALGGIKIGYTDNGKNYAVELDSDNEAFVNVPWTDTNTVYSTATSSTLGLVKIGYTENGKNYPVELSSGQMFVNVPWVDTNTVYSTATSSALGLVKIGFTESGKNYPVELNGSNQMFVNVPWTDNNTTYTASGAINLSGTEFTLKDPILLSELDESSDATSDKILLWDESGSAWKYMTLDNLQDSIDQVNVPNNATITLSAGNGLQTGGAFTTNQSSNETITLALADPATLNELNESTDATDDKMFLWDESASSWKYITLDNLQDAVQRNTNLSVTADSTQLQVNSSTGNNVDLPAATASAWGVVSDDDQTFGGVKTFSDVKATDTLTVGTKMEYETSNIVRINQRYTGGSIGTYFEDGEYQKVVTITPDGNSQNYQVLGRMVVQSGAATQTINFNAALRSNTLPDLTWEIYYNEQHTGTRYIVPRLWTKETTTAGFILAFEVLTGSIFGSVTVDMEIIPRSEDDKSNITVNTSANSEQTSIDSGFTQQNFSRIWNIIDNKITQIPKLSIGTDRTDNKLMVSDGDQGLEVNPNAGTNEVRLNAYDRTNSVYRPFVIKASELKFDDGGGQVDVLSGNNTGSLLTDILSANVITADMIQANSIVATIIDAQEITADHIAANTITASQIAADTITAAEMQISNEAEGTAGIYFNYNSGNPKITISDGTNVRVKIGYLA